MDLTDHISRLSSRLGELDGQMCSISSKISEYRHEVEGLEHDVHQLDQDGLHVLATLASSEDELKHKLEKHESLKHLKQMHEEEDRRRKVYRPRCVLLLACGDVCFPNRLRGLQKRFYDSMKKSRQAILDTMEVWNELDTSKCGRQFVEARMRQVVAQQEFHSLQMAAQANKTSLQQAFEALKEGKAVIEELVSLHAGVWAKGYMPRCVLEL
jgi:hypothetical protein